MTENVLTDTVLWRIVTLNLVQVGSQMKLHVLFLLENFIISIIGMISEEFSPCGDSAYEKNTSEN